MIRHILYFIVIISFMMSFYTLRNLSQEHNDKNKRDAKKNNATLSQHTMLLKDYQNLLSRYEDKVKHTDRLNKLVREYTLGYFGMYKYLTDKGKSVEDIKKIIEENSKEINIDLDNSGD